MVAKVEQTWSMSLICVCKDVAKTVFENNWNILCKYGHFQLGKISTILIHIIPRIFNQASAQAGASSGMGRLDSGPRFLGMVMEVAFWVLLLAILRSSRHISAFTSALRQGRLRTASFFAFADGFPSPSLLPSSEFWSSDSDAVPSDDMYAIDIISAYFAFIS